MSEPQTLVESLQKRFVDVLSSCHVDVGEVTIAVPADRIHDVCLSLRDESPFAFEQLIDLCGVDYLYFGGEGDHPWEGTRYYQTPAGDTPQDVAEGEQVRGHGRFAVVYHLLSVSANQRLRVKAFLPEDMPRIDSVVGVWPVANWFEREAFDLYGILFDGHPDLRRLLTDYGFIGHPFRKDFPLIGEVEMRYDPERRRVIYEPVSIEPRVTVPRIVRDDSRYEISAATKKEAE